VVRKRWRRNGVVIVASFVAEARKITNQLAAEHLTWMRSDLEWVEMPIGVCGRWSRNPWVITSPDRITTLPQAAWHGCAAGERERFV